ncbi:MAG: helix-turn-helix domain-containing protein [Nitrososphaera sp.]|jgi:DNA-binding HxlR family transcriptional regulator
MKKEVEPLCLCPLDGVIDTIGKKWSLLVINEIGNHHKLRFNELMQELKGISPSTLTTTLKELENQKMIIKEMFREIPPRVEYSLSPRGKELRQVIMPLLRWATKKGNYTVHCQCSLIKK